MKTGDKKARTWKEGEQALMDFFIGQGEYQEHQREAGRQENELTAREQEIDELKRKLADMRERMEYWKGLYKTLRGYLARLGIGLEERYDGFLKIIYPSHGITKRQLQRLVEQWEKSNRDGPERSLRANVPDNT